jgi:hypothetical protein
MHWVTTELIQEPILQLGDRCDSLDLALTRTPKAVYFDISLGIAMETLKKHERCKVSIMDIIYLNNKELYEAICNELRKRKSQVFE